MRLSSMALLLHVVECLTALQGVDATTRVLNNLLVARGSQSSGARSETGSTTDANSLKEIARPLRPRSRQSNTLEPSVQTGRSAIEHPTARPTKEKTPSRTAAKGRAKKQDPDYTPSRPQRPKPIGKRPRRIQEKTRASPPKNSKPDRRRPRLWDDLNRDYKGPPLFKPAPSAQQFQQEEKSTRSKPERQTQNVDPFQGAKPPVQSSRPPGPISNTETRSRLTESPREHLVDMKRGNLGGYSLATGHQRLSNHPQEPIVLSSSSE